MASSHFDLPQSLLHQKRQAPPTRFTKDTNNVLHDFSAVIFLFLLSFFFSFLALLYFSVYTFLAVSSSISRVLSFFFSSHHLLLPTSCSPVSLVLYVFLFSCQSCPSSTSFPSSFGSPPLLLLLCAFFSVLLHSGYTNSGSHSSH